MDESASEVPQIVDQDQVVSTDWRDVAKQIISLKYISQGPEKLALFQRNENLFRQALEDKNQLYSVLLTFHGLGEPRDIEAEEQKDPYLEQIRKFKTEFMVKNLGVIENYMSSSGDYHAEILNELGRYQKEEYRKYSAPMAEFFMNQYQRGYLAGADKTDFFTYLFDIGNPKQRQWAAAEAIHELSFPENMVPGKERAKALSYFAGALIHGIDEDVDFEIFDIFTQELAKFNLESEDILKTWLDSYSKNGFWEAIQRNMTAIYTLESNRPGITNTLWTEFGISCFGRYPIDLLVEQYDQRDNPNFPYGVLISAQADHNGASYFEKNAYHELHQTLHVSGVGLRVYEVSSSNELARALLRSNEKFGDKNKISFAIISGHGEKNRIILGYKKNEKLSIKDYHSSANTKIGRHLQGIKSLFIDTPTVILVSCSTGQLEGIGHEISALGARVKAPDDITSLDSISVFRDEFGALQFRVEFDESHTNTFERGALKR